MLLMQRAGVPARILWHGREGAAAMLHVARRHDRIAVDPAVMRGKPCIGRTRIPVDLILRYLGQGQTVDDILAAFPGLTAEDVRAAAAFAADVVADEAVVLAAEA